jgi:hypothetical protein
MKYDDASWHYESTQEGPEDERWNVAAAHIGVYLKWCLLRGWAGELHTCDDFGTAGLKKVQSAEMTGTEFFISHCDCKFTDEDLDDEGNAFTAYYYEGDFVSDLESIEEGKVLSSPEGNFDFNRLSELFNRRYEEWVSSGRPATKKKPWWRFGR